MSRRLTGTVLAVGILGGALLFWQIARGDGDAPAPGDRGPAPAAQPPPETKRMSSAAPAPELFELVSMDDDPIGPLRLEGIVLDEDDHPVAGATVFLDSNPPRTTITNDDGSFHFERLVGRLYTLSALTDDAAGGPVALRLTADSDPVAIRVRAGAEIEVAVIAKADGTPIPGATVGLDANARRTAEADERGVAVLRGVLPGGKILYAEAPGYARHKQIITVADDAGLTLRQQVALARGARVAGRVLDPNGAPVAGADVVPFNASETFVPRNRRTDGVRTDREGKFAIPALAAGSYRFVAHHAEHPPSTTEPIELDGSTERNDIVIVVEDGGSIAGRVVTRHGEPVPWANVHVGPDPDRAGWGRVRSGSRTAYADEQGSFHVKGVPRGQLVAMASSETASSELVAVDLREVPKRTGLELRLDIDGAIAGTVVDERGEPIAEAQVLALPDFWNGEPIGRVRIAGPSFATTNGGGRFAIRGLTDGAYRLHASRTEIGRNAFALERGVAARVGDDEVRIVLQTEGGVGGKLALSDGGRPEFATVSVGAKLGVPARDGEFRVVGLPPGTYDVTVRGPQFEDYVAKDVAIEPGEVTDLGTLKLQSGRAVRGRVVDRNGAPVGGAQVATARQLISDGNSLVPALGALFEEQFGLRRVTTDPDGGFRISGIGDGERVIAAEHPDRGRSLGVAVPRGTEDVTVELELVPFGKLAGKVTVNGEPTAGAGLIIAGAASERHTIRAQAGPDGSFALERIPAGSYKVTAAIGSGGTATMGSARATVVAGQTADVTIDINTGTIALEVGVRGEADAPIDAAQVFLLGGELHATSVKQMLQAFSSSSASSARQTFVFPPKTTELAALNAGSYTLCVIPINGDLSDPTFKQRLQKQLDHLAVHCGPVEIQPRPERQRHVAVVPPMNPLPE